MPGGFGLITALPFLSLATMLAVEPARADDPPTEFSRQVTQLTGDWEAEDWNKGALMLHPTMFNAQSDIKVRLLPRETVMGRDAIAAAREHFDGDSLGDDTTNPTRVSMDGAKEIAPGVLAASYSWSYAFDENLSFFGVVSTLDGGYVPFSANCEKDDPDRPQDYKLEPCLKGMIKILIAVRGLDQGGLRLQLPDPPAPLSVAGWDSQFLKDGRHLAVTGSFNGLRKAFLHVTPPMAIPAANLPEALKAFSDTIIDDNDQADKDPGSLKVVGSAGDPWLRREFPEAFDGPSIQMAGAQKVADGSYVLIGIRCPNAGWLTTCAYGVDQAKRQIKSGELEARRQAYIAARQSPLLPNGMKTSDIEAVYGKPEFDGSSFVIRAHILFHDGSVYRGLDVAPQMFDAAQSRAKEPGDWGKWTRRGEVVHIVWGDGDTDDIEASNETLMVAGNAQTRLSGRYETSSSGGNVMTGTSFVSRSAYTFSPDGTFESDRSSSFSVGGFLPGGFTPQTIAAGGSSSATGKARYDIDGYMITFRYPNGEIERESFALFASEAAAGAAKVVLVGGTPYSLDE